MTEPRYVEELGRVIPWIIGGEPTWQGQSLEDCQRYIITYGFRAFDREMQHNVQDVEGALLSTETINQTRIKAKDLPPLTRVAVGVDPASTSKASSNETGIIGGGRTADRHGYVLADQSGTLAPAVWGRRAVLLLDVLAAEHDCPGRIVAEKNNGGEMVELVIATAAEKLCSEGLRPDEERGLSLKERRLLFEDVVDEGGEVVREAPYVKGEEGIYHRRSKHVPVKLVHASKGKRARAEPVAQLYEEAALHHAGAFDELETQWTTWDASSGEESPDRIDAAVWMVTELGIVRLSPDPAPAAYTQPIDRPTDGLLDAYNRMG